MIRATWPLPVLLAVLSCAGLLAALTGDGWRDALSWAGLAAPVIATGWAWRRSRTLHPRGTRP